jgi:hypothetical protein
VFQQLSFPNMPFANFERKKNYVRTLLVPKLSTNVSIFDVDMFFRLCSDSSERYTVSNDRAVIVSCSHYITIVKSYLTLM